MSDYSAFAMVSTEVFVEEWGISKGNKHQCQTTNVDANVTCYKHTVDKTREKNSKGSHKVGSRNQIVNS